MLSFSKAVHLLTFPADSSLFQWGEEQQAASQCASPISQSTQSEPPHISKENFFRDIEFDMQDFWNDGDQNQLWQNILGDDIAQFFSAPNVSMLPGDVGCSMTASCRRWLKLATLVKSMAMLRACRSNTKSSTQI